MTLHEDDDVITDGSISAEDLGHTHRFTVKTGMSYWVDVDYSNPTRARLLLTEGEDFDTDDQVTHDILLLEPEFVDGGELPP